MRNIKLTFIELEVGGICTSRKCRLKHLKKYIKISHVHLGSTKKSCSYYVIRNDATYI